MNKKTLTLLLLASITLLSVAGVKVSKLTRTTSFASNDLFIVVTGSTTKVTRHIRAQDLAVGLGPWITNSGSGTGGSATNAQPQSTTLSNLATSFGGSNRVMVSALDVQVTNAFKRFYFDTNVAHILSNLVASASSGDVVELGAGRFYIGVQSIRPAVGVTLKGQGRGITFIYGDVGGTPATNPIVQLVSSNIIEDMTIVANKKGSYYQWPMGASTVWGNTAPTNVTVRRVELDGDTDCITVSHTAFTSGTLEDCYLHSGGDVFNLEAGYTPTVNGEQIGGSWTFRRTRFYSDASIIQQASWAANPIANAFQISNARAYFYDCEIIATNHKATAVLIVGGDTNRVELFNTVISATGTNGYGYEVDDQSGFGELITDVIIHNTALVASTDIDGSPITTFRPTQVGSLNASAIKFVSGLASNSFLYLKADTNVAAGTFGSGLTFSGGTLTASAGAGAQTGSFILTNFALMGISNIVSANGNTVITTNSGVLTLTTSSGGALATNANQFGASVTLTIASGALLTNLQVRGIDPLGLTVSRALSLNASGDITNGTTTAAELEFVNGVTSAIQTQLNGKQNGQTNSSQFGASTTLTLADRLSVTNLNSYGTGAVFSGHVTVSSNITAGSFIGSGTGVPILKLQTMMAADNSLAFSVRTNFTQLSTNFFEFTSPSAGQGFRLHSVANGQLVWTNALDVEMPTQGLISNVTQITYQMHSGSVVGANSNQTIWLGQTNVSDLLISTNVTFTNFNGITAGRSASFTAFMKVTNAAANVGVNWGNLGGSNPGYAVALWTNANAPMWTTLTNTKTYVLSVTSRGTNLHPTITLWE